MAISNELSGEIATALFAAKERSPRELHDLKDMVFEIHSTLQRLAENARVDRLRLVRDQNPERFFIKSQS